MNLNNYTIKSQEAIQQAVTITTANGQQAIEPAHILKGILEVDESVTPFILKKLNVNPTSFARTVDSIINSYPKVSGGLRSRINTSVLVRGKHFPARMKKGTPCQRQESTCRRKAANVSVRESRATPFSDL